MSQEGSAVPGDEAATVNPTGEAEPARDATTAAGTLLLLELWPVINWLGGVFERVDINEVAQGV